VFPDQRNGRKNQQNNTGEVNQEGLSLTSPIVLVHAVHSLIKSKPQNKYSPSFLACQGENVFQTRLSRPVDAHATPTPNRAPTLLVTSVTVTG
jgi:hypothetical protein